ncbi:MAG: hypothetical protein GY873_29020, partial [Bosea sp.]|uniref:hypothetical protein n=1 Tax=Bosea sp. (in: a-proteobacteria) TaxID=1871050 RepID=UPI002382DDE5|nr:hypothetical protein [Bosea sp. (in: a-proteobacteria)]
AHPFQAAQQRGDVVATRMRLEAALAQWSTDLARNWLANINANFGQIAITLPTRGRAAMAISIDEMPFEPERRLAIDFAQQQLDTDRSFEGYLPIGRYRIGDQSFTVISGRRILVEASRSAPEPTDAAASRGDRLVSGRIRAGIGYARAGTPRAGIQPVSFSGMSPRAGLGLGIHPSERIGIGLEVGWTGAFSSPNMLSLGYGMLALEGSLSTEERPITIGAGPMVGAGSGAITGLDAAALAAYCEDKTAVACSGLSLGGEGSSSVTGSLRAVGPALTASVPLFSGASGGGSGILMAAVLSDGSRLYPVAQLGIQLSIGGRR